MAAPKHPWVRAIEPRLWEVSIPSGARSEDIRGFAAAALAHYRASEGSFAWVADATALRLTDALFRRAAGEGFQEHAPILERRCRAIAFAVSHPVVEGAVRAIFWMAPPAYPTRTFRDVAEARHWARASLAG